MKKRVYLSRKDKKAAIARVKAGETQEAVAKDIGVNASTLSYWRKGRGIKGKRGVDDEVRKKAVARVRAGERQIDVAKDVGVSQPALCKWLKAVREPSVKRRLITNEVKEKVLKELRSTNNSFLAIARKYKISYHSVAGIKKEMERKEHFSNTYRPNEVLSLEEENRQLKNLIVSLLLRGLK